MSKVSASSFVLFILGQLTSIPPWNNKLGDRKGVRFDYL